LHFTNELGKDIDKLEHKGEVLIYRADDGKTNIDVTLEDETVWLTQVQMARLFGKDARTVSEHIANVYQEKELRRDPTIRKFRLVRKEGKRDVERMIDHYNLDVIISVGYRVKSKRGIQFRIWATQVLREHLVKGFTANDRRLKELRQAVHLITEYAERRDLSGDEAKALLHVVDDYTFALDLLDDYDHQRIAVTSISGRPIIPVTYEDALRVIDRLRQKFHASELFGREKVVKRRQRICCIFL
jgi:hypothetical protein